MPSEHVFHLNDRTVMKNAAHDSNRPAVIVLATSKAWQAAIKQHFGSMTIVWALDAQDTANEAARFPDAAIVIELTSQPQQKLALTLRKLLQHRRLVFLVTQIGLQSSAEPFRRLGIADVIVTISQTDRLHSMIARYNRGLEQHSLTLEQQIESALPWR